MKKLCVSIALVLWCLAQGAVAQNMYRNYQSTWVSKPTSAVSVVHSNGYVYFFQADGSGNLSATEIDPLSMIPTGNEKYFDMTQTGFNFSMNGGFEDANGNFVLFGYYKNGYNRHPLYAIISSNLSYCKPYCQNGIFGEYTAGCDGFDRYLGEVYMFVNNRILLAVEAVSPTTLHPFELDMVTNPNDYYTDVSWDAVHDKFIATGFALDVSAGIQDPFVQVFDILNYSVISTVAEYCVANQTYSMSNENKVLHVQLDNNDLILYYDLRHKDDVIPFYHDIIWLSRIKNFWDINTATITESRFYELPSTKLFAKDMIYDSYNKRLNFLGYLNKCMEGLIHILAQVDPFTLSLGAEVGQLGATFTGGNCQNNEYPTNENIAYNDFEMFNLTLNKYNPCCPVLIAGVGKKLPILTETYDISLSSCDKPMWHTDLNANPLIKPYTLHVPFVQGSVTPIPVIAFTDSIAVYEMCYETEACSHQFGGKSSQKPMTSSKPAPDITIENNSLFTCDGFEGEIQFFLYDIAGKLLQQGITQNKERNLLNLREGIYLLQAVDRSSNQIVKKIILL